MAEQQCSSSNNSRVSNSRPEILNKVEVNTPTVPSASAHLYPRLAGSNWTSYLSIPVIVVGRSEVQTRQPPQSPSSMQQQAAASADKECPPCKKQRQNVVHIDFPECKAISRRHCEFRFSTRRDRWELYVYGRNGVKVDHILKRPTDKPVVLKTGTLIEVNNTRFVFILPMQHIRPSKRSLSDHQGQQGQNRHDSIGPLASSSSSSLSEGTSSFNLPEIKAAANSHFDTALEMAIVQLLKTSNVKNSRLSTVDITAKINNAEGGDLEGLVVSNEDVLRVLNRSNKFQLSPGCTSPSISRSGAVEWMLAAKDASPVLSSASSPCERPTTVEEEENSAATQRSSNAHTPGSTPTTAEKASSVSTTLTQYPSSLSGILRELDEVEVDDTPYNEWSFDYTSTKPILDSQTSSKTSERGTVERNVNEGQPAYPYFCPSTVTCATNATNRTSPSSKSSLQSTQIMTTSSPILPDTTVSFSVPRASAQQDRAAPARFTGLSIESIYSIWNAASCPSVSRTTFGSGAEASEVDEGSDSSSRSDSLSGSGSLKDGQNTTTAHIKEYDEKNSIYHQIRTKIMF